MTFDKENQTWKKGTYGKETDVPPVAVKKEKRQRPVVEKEPENITKEEFEKRTEALMNPMPAKDFDPTTFDPMKLNGHPHAEVGARDRVDPPKRLPTMGLKPKKIREGQMVGMYESKQDLYLLIAALYERVADLEEQIALITQQKSK